MVDGEALVSLQLDLVTEKTINITNFHRLKDSIAMESFHIGCFMLNYSKEYAFDLQMDLSHN